MGRKDLTYSDWTCILLEKVMRKKKQFKLPGKRLELREKKKEKRKDKKPSSMHQRFVVNVNMMKAQLINQNAVEILLGTFVISDARKVTHLTKEKDKLRTVLVTNETSANGLMFQIAFKQKLQKQTLKTYSKEIF